MLCGSGVGWNRQLLEWGGAHSCCCVGVEWGGIDSCWSGVEHTAEWGGVEHTAEWGGVGWSTQLGGVWVEQTAVAVWEWSGVE